MSVQELIDKLNALDDNQKKLPVILDRSEDNILEPDFVGETKRYRRVYRDKTYVPEEVRCIVIGKAFEK